MSSEPGTRLVVVGRRSRLPGCAVFVGCLALGCIAGALAWSGVPPLAEFQGVSPFLPFLGFMAALFASHSVFQRIVARIGRVTFDGDRIVFERDGYTTLVTPDDLAGYRDDERDLIELVRRRGAPVAREFPRLTIPTPTEAVRLAVLVELEGLGIPRREGDEWVLSWSDPRARLVAPEEVRSRPLTVTGAHSWSTGRGVLLVWVLAGGGALVLTATGEAPWLPLLPRPLVGLGILLGSTFGAVLTSFLVVRRSKARAGHVVFHERWIVFLRAAETTTVGFDEIQGFRDGDADFVELVRKPGVSASIAFPRLTVPTPTEKDRVAVLAVLDARGIRRLDS
ncbi:MAG: hypothetical protein ACAI25_03410 [Planctomycetota bacterium]